MSPCSLFSSLPPSLPLSVLSVAVVFCPCLVRCSLSPLELVGSSDSDSTSIRLHSTPPNHHNSTRRHRQSGEMRDTHTPHAWEHNTRHTRWKCNAHSHWQIGISGSTLATVQYMSEDRSMHSLKSCMCVHTRCRSCMVDRVSSHRIGSLFHPSVPICSSIGTERRHSRRLGALGKRHRTTEKQMIGITLRNNERVAVSYGGVWCVGCVEVILIGMTHEIVFDSGHCITAPCVG